ncbi:hypothetical protein FF36_06346, partial [Frankia torreyi]
GTAGSGTAGSGTAGSGTAGSGTAGSGTAGSGTTVAGAHGAALAPFALSVAHDAGLAVAIARPATPASGSGGVGIALARIDPDGARSPAGPAVADPDEDRLLRRLGGDGRGDTPPRWRARFAAARQAASRAGGHPAARVVAAGSDGTLTVAVGAAPDGGPGGPGTPPQRYAVAYAETEAPAAQQEHATAGTRHRYVVAWTTGAASREESNQ